MKIYNTLRCFSAGFFLALGFGGLGYLLCGNLGFTFGIIISLGLVLNEEDAR